MNKEDHAWEQLRDHAARRLRSNFAQSVLHQARAGDATTWAKLRDHAAAQIRPGFAERVLRAARALTSAPSLWDQLAMCAATATLCLLAVLFIDERNHRVDEQANLASWAQLGDEMQNLDGPQ